MLNLKQFIADHVINRQISMFAADIEANKETLRREIENKSRFHRFFIYSCCVAFQTGQTGGCRSQ